MSHTPPLASALGLPPKLAPGCAVLLDFDGTLVEIADHPDGVVINPALAGLLQRLAGTFQGRVALVSGRSVTQIDSFFGNALAGIAVVGSHGAEVRIGSQELTAERPRALAEAEHEIRAAFANVEGVVVEVKTLGVAVHYRMAAEVEPEARALTSRLVAESGLALQEGKMMLELRTAGHDKGTGIASLMAQPPFAGSVPVFAGDDVTDEDGFASVTRLGGHGVLVGAARATAAQYRLPDVMSVHAWLERSA
jgi:trehalose 6-phosphate phosphatase